MVIRAIGKVSLTPVDAFSARETDMRPANVTCALLAFLGVLLVRPTSAAPEAWWNDGWEARVPIAVEPRPGLLARRPVVLRWGEVAEKLGDASVRLSSLRLVSGGELVPFQVDHRDRSGNLLPPGDLSLDPQDELVFVCPADRQTDLHLYLSEIPKPLLTLPSGMKVTLGKRGAPPQTLSTAGLTVRINGPGLLDLSVNSPANDGRGAAGVSWRGVGLVCPGMNYGVWVNLHPFADRANRWQMAKLLVDGPVRKVVAVPCLDYHNKAQDGTTVLRADVTRFFSMFSDVPLYDVEDVVRCMEVQPSWTATYTDRFFAGHNLDENDVLWDGSSGEFRRFAPKQHYEEAVRTEKIVDGWYGWFDEEERMGLAVFYAAEEGGDRGALPVQTSFQSRWEVWSTENRMSFAYKDLKAPVTLRHRFRLVGLPDVAPELVASEHRLWAGDGAVSVTVGPEERR